MQRSPSNPGYPEQASKMGQTKARNHDGYGGAPQRDPEAYGGEAEDTRVGGIQEQAKVCWGRRRKIANEGEVDFPFEALEEQKISMTFQIAEVSKPLGAVSYFVDRNYRVVYDKQNVTGKDLSYMVFKPTREV